MKCNEGVNDVERLERAAASVRRLILRTVHRAGMGHTGGSLSEADILAALYFKVMRGIDPSRPEAPERDRFILSKGHASAGYYATLAARGYFPVADLELFDELESPLQAHPDMHRAVGVDFSTGSLGQGLSCGIGMAMASFAPHCERRFRTFVLLGDGECQEGQVWEAALYAGANRIKGIIAIVDANGVQLASRISGLAGLEPLADKWRSFGWSTIETDGHDMGRLAEDLERARELAAEGPVAVVARTVKGKGVSFMEGRCEWHGKAPNDEEFEAALKEIPE